jgi:hypothetical protein
VAAGGALWLFQNEDEGRGWSGFVREFKRTIELFQTSSSDG